jgi:RsiW-degrading membrane proteinase PrsW (M82 family)
MFSEVFKKHTDDEVEAYFTVGTAKTIPDIIQVDTTWPRPWVFFRTFAGAMLVYVGFLVRGMLDPFAHIVWTAMSAAALWKVKGDQPFTFDMVQDSRFLRVFGIAVVLHMLWSYH